MSSRISTYPSTNESLSTRQSKLRIAVHAKHFFRSEEGQMAPMLLTAFMVCYSAFMGTAIDMSNLWLHKYRASTAATAACESGAADVLWAANNSPTQFATSSAGFMTASTGGAGGQVSGNCSSSSPNVAMCAYARANGYDPADTSRQVDVAWVLSSTGPSNAQTTPPSLPNGVLPYLRVAVSENVKTYMLGLIPGFHSPVKVTGFCNCGLVGTSASGGAFPWFMLEAWLSTVDTVKVIGGGPVAFDATEGPAVQNLSSACQGGGLDFQICNYYGSRSNFIDTSQGGVSYTGSSIGISSTYGALAPGSFYANNTAGILSGSAAPISLINLPNVVGVNGPRWENESNSRDPFDGKVPEPVSVKSQVPLTAQQSQKNFGSGGVSVSYGQDGCPAHSGCLEVGPGYYPTGLAGYGIYPSQGFFQGNSQYPIEVPLDGVILFLPGVYYFDGPLWGGQHAVYRVATPCTPSCSTIASANNLKYKQTDGVTFFFNNIPSAAYWKTGTIYTDPDQETTSYPSQDNIDAAPASSLLCDGSAPDARIGLPTAINGSVLYGPCTANGTYVDPADNPSESIGNVRGMVAIAPQMTVSMFGDFVIAGTIYDPVGTDQIWEAGTVAVGSKAPPSPTTIYVLGDVVCQGFQTSAPLVFAPMVPSGNTQTTTLKVATFSSN